MKFFFEKKEPFFLLLLLLLLGGIYSLSQISTQLYPQTEQPRLFLRFTHQGVGAQDFYNDWAEKIETEISALDELETYYITYGPERTVGRLYFNWNSNRDEAESGVQTLVNNLENLLPEDYSVRSYFSDGTDAGYIWSSVASEKESPNLVYSRLKQVFLPLLRSELGDEVEDIWLSAVEQLEVEVTLNHQKMLQNKISILEVQSAFSKGYLPSPLGTLETEDEDYTLRLQGDVEAVQEIGELLIAQRGDFYVRLKDIAQVDFLYAPGRSILARNGEQVLSLYVSPADGANIRELAERTKTLFEQLVKEEKLPEDYRYLAMIDPGEFIDTAIDGILFSGLLGAILAIIIVLFTLGEWRNTLLIALSLPCSIILSFWLMRASGITINLISLGGMALAIGMIVDASIVVIENIDRHLKMVDHLQKGEKRSIIIEAVREVIPSIVVSTLTSILVFAPLVFTAPLSNAILGEQALTVIFTLCLSLLVSLLFIPLFSDSLSTIRQNREETKLHQLTHWVGYIERLYERLLERLLLSKKRQALFVGLFVLALILSSLFLLPRIKQELLPAPNGDLLYLVVDYTEEFEKRELLEEKAPDVDKKVRAILEKDLLKLPDAPEGVTFWTIYDGRMTLYYRLKSEKLVPSRVEALEAIFEDTDTESYTVKSWDPAALPLPTNFDLDIRLNPQSDEEGIRLLAEINEKLNEDPRVLRTYVDPWPLTYNQELIFTPRKKQIEGLGTNQANLEQKIVRIFRGTSKLEFTIEDDVIEISAEYPEDMLDNQEKLENFILSVNGEYVPIKHLFDISRKSSISGLYTEDGEKKFRLRLRLKSTIRLPRPESESTGESKNSQKESSPKENSPKENSPKESSPPIRTKKLDSKEKKEIAEELKVMLSEFAPSGILTFPDPNPDTTAAIRSLSFSLILSILLIFLLLSFQFGNLKEPLIVLITIPSALMGVIISLWVFHSSVSLNSLLGSILLVGVAVNNAIIILDFYRVLIEKENPEERDLEQHKVQTLLTCANLRFKPILITTLTTILGMLPMAIGLGSGSSIVQPLGIAVSGGLFFSTLLSLFLVPLAIFYLGTSSSKKETAKK